MVPETPDTTTILIRFCLAIAIIDDERGEPFPDFLRFAFFGAVFAGIAIP